jgi:membrane associated rhomboid family serine protease
MSSGADLFVVCKQCGSEVSPYITECPYCGHRLRRRAPKLPRASTPSRSRRGRRGRWPIGGRSPSASEHSRPRRSRLFSATDRWAVTRPYATIVLVAASAAVWVAIHARPQLFFEMAIVGPLQGDWWKLVTSEFTYLNGLYAFVTLVAIAIFGWLLERRHGPLVVVALFLAAGATGALVATAVYPYPIVSGGNAAALALLAAWAMPDLRAARAGVHYEGDLLGTAAIAALLLAIPFAGTSASWLAGVTGGVVGILVGLGLSRGEHSQL